MKLPFSSWRSLAVILATSTLILLANVTAVVHEHHIKVNFDSLHDLIGDRSNDQQQSPTEMIENRFLVQKIGQLKNEKEQLELSQSTMMLSLKNLQIETDRMQYDNLVLQEIIQSQQEEKDTTHSGDGGFWWQIITLVLSVISIVQYVMGMSRIRALNDVKNDKTTLLTHTKTLETRINVLQDQLKLSHINLTKALKDRDSLLNETTILEDRLLELQDRIEIDKTTMTKLKKEKERLSSRIVILEDQARLQSQAQPSQVEAVIPLAQTSVVTAAAMIVHGCDVVTDAVQGNEFLARESTTNNHSFPSPPPPPPPSSSINNGLTQQEVTDGAVERGEGNNSVAETLRGGEMAEKEEMEGGRLTTLTAVYETPGSNSSSVRGKRTSTSMFSSGNGTATSEGKSSLMAMTHSSISLARSANVRRSTNNYQHRRSKDNHHHNHAPTSATAAALLSTPFSDATLSDTGSVERLGQGMSAHGQGPGSNVLPRPRSRR